MEQWWNDDLQGKTEETGENFATSSTTNLTRVCAVKIQREYLKNITSDR
jgi:hypothetical protein